MRDPRERLLDILEAMDRIQRYAELGRERFDSDELVQNWIVHHLQIVGEAAGKLGKEFHAQHPGIPWAHIVAMRNILVHDYFGVDLDEVWHVVEHDLPALQGQLKKLL